MGQLCSLEQASKLRRVDQCKATALGVLASCFAIACSFGQISNEPNLGDGPGETPGDVSNDDPVPTPADTPSDGSPNATVPTPPSEPVSPQEAQALRVLEVNCNGCHGAANQGNINYITNKSTLIANGKIVEGDPDSSPIFVMMSQQRMPPASVSPRPTTGDIEIVRQWIDGLAEVKPCTHDGGFVSFDEMYAAMSSDVLTVRAADRPFIRYLGVVNAYNAGACGAALEAEQYALFKAINSVSTEAQIVQPRAIDDRGLIYRIDLRDYGWDRALEVQPGDTKIEIIGGVATATNSDPSPPLPFDDGWEAILDFSAPYAVEFTGEDADLLKVQTNTLVPFLQVDAFIAAATTQNLYYALTDAPETLGDLLAQLGVDQVDQAERAVAKRAGFSTSGVSKQERSVMRFEINRPGGYFWASFDFADNGKANVSIFAEPLASDAGAAGGEFIYSLPNGMMGFYIAANDGNGSRLTEAPVDVVVDPLQVKNNKAVINGVSCNSCHERGIFPFTDKVREWVLANRLDYDSEVYQSVLELYVPNEEMLTVVKADSESFKSSLKDAGVPIDFSDPVTRVYLDFLGAQITKPTAAGDLGVPAALLEQQMSRLDGRLRGVLSQGIDRELFDELYVDALCALQTASENQPLDCP